MTRDTLRVRDDRGTLSDADIYAALWATAPFPRLPDGASESFRRLTVEVDDPKRIYGIHKARRRHNFQVLVERYVLQIRYGCPSTTCTTTTCFSSRRRVANGAPVRRYNSVSARTLAIYMASQDNPEMGLCHHNSAELFPADIPEPSMSKPKLASNSRTSSVHIAGVKSHRQETPKTVPKNGAFVEDLPDVDGHCEETRPSEKNSRRNLELGITLPDDPVTTDPRSFVQNMFGTVAFRMIEWLNPRNFALIAQAQNPDGVAAPPSTISATPAQENGEDAISNAKYDPQVHGMVEPGSSNDPDNDFGVTNSSSSTSGPGELSLSTLPVAPKPQSTISQSTGSQDPHHGVVPESRSRVNSIARTALGSNRRKKSDTTEPPTQKGILTKSHKSLETANESCHTSATVSSITKHKIPKQTILTNSKMHTIPDLTQVHEFKQTSTTSSVESSETSELENKYGSSKSPEKKYALTSPTTKSSETPEERSQPPADVLLPQSMANLSTPSILIMCDIMQNHGMSEKHLFAPPSIESSWKTTHEHQVFSFPNESWKQNMSSESTSQWKKFIEQSFFDVLGKPDSLLDSFSNEQSKLLDSQSIWYLMLRMTRVTPSLVLDSLWKVTEILFRPPRQLKEAYEWAKDEKTHSRKSLSNNEAAQVISICLHALIAVAPLVSDPHQIASMSRIRSYGLTMLGRQSSAMEPVELYLAYEDAFANEYAFRLARRLFASIPTRRQFMELLSHQKSHQRSNQIGETTERDVLDMVLEVLKPVDLRATSIIRFSDEERDLHEKRVPTLLLDWARTVMLQEWEGSAEVPRDGPFGGALAMMAAIYKHRKSLILGDIHFRTEYFADRLDPIATPLEWLLYDQKKKTIHLLDHPYLFNPSTLVSYFRAINYSRMNQSYEEAHTTGQLVSHFMSEGSLVTDNLKRDKLHERLRTATSEFMVLNIRRSNVLVDTFNAIWRREERELMRPLKVRLGEEGGVQGLDSGGVQQEFFRLAIAEALNPDYGTFTIDSRTKMTWFQPGSPEPLWKFELIGMIVSLAVYNGLNLPVTFPKALYRKLLDEEVAELHHIADGWPDLTNGLTTLLEWDEKDGTVEDIFARTYEFSVDIFGTPISREMNSSSPRWPQFSDLVHNTNPLDAPLVTNSNRNAYVSDYIRYLTSVSIAPQYSAFKKGFFSCISRKSISLFSPETLQSVIEGIQEIDISDMRRATRYIGWDASHRSIKDFWSIVKKFDLGQKRRLLEFVTASDRVPVGGMRNLQFTLQRNGVDDGHLPTSYTCYGILLLPEYSSKDVLREKLSMALENSKGFGFA
ncbi:related to ubiquitin-protein ligase [Rhynchosporium graminicola]|uniref:HECT-type E3 ubiquitin transferase n=1 Tax=Rhynchosporium graminicola TaxID=2792576 RepID=A0A1E1KFG6_9HELO|nr:related to ubiquitin-protein ligase [Rhynchosporium commune]